MKTICAQCGKILTDEFGNRLHSANFDSEIPHPTKYFTYAWCNICAAKRKNGEKKRYVRIYFRDHNRKAKWYWAIKIKNKKYIRCKKDGGDFSYMRKCGTEIEKLYIMFGEPEKEIPAWLSSHYGWLVTI